jgi:signal transduction histidine kinase/CheY-like chemotaxis protein
MLDSLSIMKFSQILSGEVVLESLLEKLMKIIMQNAGAQKGFLILKNEELNTFTIEAYGSAERKKITLMQSFPIEKSHNLCSNIVLYTARTKQPLVINDAGQDSNFKNDKYVLTKKPKSIMSAPILKQGNIMGIIYLENNLMPNAFTNERVDIINILATQAAVSISNAQLFKERTALAQSLEKKVEEQTDKIKSTNKNLQIINLKLAQAKIEADRANTFKSLFLANISHDLRTPLHVIIGSLDIALKSASIKKHPELFNYLDIAIKSAERQLSIVNDVLDLSKLEKGKIEINVESFTIEELVCDLKEAMKTLIHKGVKYIEEININKNIFIKSDKKRLHQVIMNLLGNAAKFTNKGHVKFQVFSQNNKLFFKVIDSGIGLKTEDKYRVFEAYAQVKDNKTPTYQGTGLGLTISKGYIEAMGGKIIVESEFGKGSTFSFWVPLIMGKRPIKTIKSKITFLNQTDLAKIKKLHILLCDDDDFNRVYAKMILEGKANYILVDSGEKALEEVKNKEFDIILMDIQMPGMDGMEAIRRIRANESVQRTPIIAITALAMVGDRERCLEAGADEYLSKPVGFDHLYQVMREMLRRT